MARSGMLSLLVDVRQCVCDYAFGMMQQMFPDFSIPEDLFFICDRASHSNVKLTPSIRAPEPSGSWDLLDHLVTGLPRFETLPELTPNEWMICISLRTLLSRGLLAYYLPDSITPFDVTRALLVAWVLRTVLAPSQRVVKDVPVNATLVFIFPSPLKSYFQ